MRRIIFPLLATTALLPALAGCDEVGGLLEDLACVPGTTPADVDGTWALTGEGERTGCSEEGRDGPTTLDSQPITVAVSSGRLALASPVQGFTFSGTVSGNDVDFEAKGGGLDLSFAGCAEGGGRTIAGNFVGTEADGCQLEGTFTVSVAP